MFIKVATIIDFSEQESASESLHPLSSTGASKIRDFKQGENIFILEIDNRMKKITITSLQTLFKIYTSSIEICDNVDVRVLISTSKSKRNVIEQIEKMDFVFVDQFECKSPATIVDDLKLRDGFESFIDETNPIYNSVVLGGTVSY